MSETIQSGDPYSIFTYAIKSPNTKDKYIRRLKRFFIFCNLGGTINVQAHDFVAMGRDWAEVRILQFLVSLKRQVDQKETVAVTMWGYVAAIKLFCEMNQILIPWKRLLRGLPRGKKYAKDRAPTTEEIVQLCKYPDRRIKAIIYPMVSGGFRVGAWEYLKWGDVLYIPEKDVARVRIYEGEDEEYFTYISGEAYRAVKEWMDFRQMSGEHITKDSWILRKLWDLHTGAICKPHSPQATEPEKLRLEGLKSLIHDAIKAQGIRSSLPRGKKRYEFKAMHGFRKYFKTRAEQVMKPINVEILMSHSVGVSDSYYRPTENDLLEDYLKAVPLLTIESQSVPSKDTERIEKEIEDLRAKISQLAHFYIDSGQAKPIQEGK